MGWYLRNRRNWAIGTFELWKQQNMASGAIEIDVRVLGIGFEFYGWHWQIVHSETRTVVNDGFVRCLPDAVEKELPAGKIGIHGFERVVIPVYVPKG